MNTEEYASLDDHHQGQICAITLITRFYELVHPRDARRPHSLDCNTKSEYFSQTLCTKCPLLDVTVL